MSMTLEPNNISTAADSRRSGRGNAAKALRRVEERARVAQQIRAFDFTQKDVATLAGVSTASIARLLHGGAVSVDTCHAILRAVDLIPADFSHLARQRKKRGKRA